MPFAKVSPGVVTIGDPKEGLAREVRVTQSFCLGKFEVTQEQWKALMPKNPSNNQGSDLPVEHVSADEAEQYVRRLNELDPAGNYRIASEAEWMRAFTAGGGSPDLQEVSRFGNCKTGDRFDKTAPVGSFEPNRLGIYDQIGNVSEWVSSEEPSGGGPTHERVRLGGSFINNSANCVDAYRTRSKRGRHDEEVGFRIVRDVVKP